MSGHDIFLISPPMAMAALGILVILFDLIFSRKSMLVVVAFLGLAAPLAFVVLQTLEISSSGVTDLVPTGTLLAHSVAVDRFTLFFYFLIIASVAIVILASVDYVRRMASKEGEYFGLILISAAGMMLLVSAHELVTIYISLELITLPLAALAAFLLTPRSTEAGMKFLIVGAISSAIMLYGMALIFGSSGSTSLAGIAASLQSQAHQNVPFGSYAMLVGVVLMVAGLGFKLSSVPFHMWVPDVYEGAPTPVVGFLSVASKAAAFALVLRVFYTGLFAVQVDWVILLAVLAAASMTLGNLAAISQSNIKRLFGYSTVAHAGYILIGVAAIAGGDDGSGSDTFGPSSVLFYLAGYAAANLTAFSAITAISNCIDSDRIEDYAGMVKRSPFLAVALGLSLVALIGVPPTSVFIAKIYIFTAAVNSGLVWLAVLGVINSVVSAYYYVQVMRVMFVEPAKSQEAVAGSWASRLAVTVAGVAMVWIGLAPGVVLGAAESAVTVLAVVR